MSNGTNGDKAALANRVTTWVAIVGMGMYVMNMGQWVGAADEKLEDAATVEVTQKAILLQQATMIAEQAHMKEAVEDIKEQAEKDKNEILDAIKDAHEDDE